MFKDFFKRQINNITVAAALIALSSLASRFLGIIRDRILASQFGAGTTLDIYYAAFRIPDLIYNLIILGALSAGFIPIFTGLIKDFKATYSQNNPESKNKPAWDLVSNILNILSLALLVLSIIGIIFAPLLIRLISPGFGPEEQAATASLTRIMFLSPLFLGISGILGGVLQSFKRFLVYSLAPIFYNVGIIIGALYFVKIDGLNGLAWGVVLGAFLHMLIQIPVVYSLGFRYKFRINFKDKAARMIAKMMVPRTLSLAISQINLIVITIIASNLDSGSLTVFNFANNLQSFPIGIFGISFAIAAFPSLAEHARNHNKLAETFSQAMRQILFFIIPATVLIITLRAQIIRVVLGSGNFDWQDTILTMNTLGFFALSLFAQSTIPLLTRVYYARHNSATPFYFGLFTIAVNIVLSFWFGKTMGVAGLALAYSVANVLNLILLWAWLYFKVGALDLINILISSGKFIIAALAAGIATQIMKVLIWPFIDMTKLSGVFTQLFIAMLAGLIVYGFFCYLFKSEELFWLLSSLSKRWPFKKIKVEDQGEARGV
ncbi:MAG: murein biosynthesis integral membrane protein MurJ [Patescibacteria group bacterium]